MFFLGSNELGPSELLFSLTGFSHIQTSFISTRSHCFHQDSGYISHHHKRHAYDELKYYIRLVPNWQIQSLVSRRFVRVYIRGRAISTQFLVFLYSLYGCFFSNTGCLFHKSTQVMLNIIYLYNQSREKLVQINSVLKWNFGSVSVLWH